MKPKLRIDYCPKCRWLLRAAWIQQELLTTFEEEIGEFALKPSDNSGEFNIFLNNEILYSRRVSGGFPDLKDLKILIRDKIAPTKTLGHSEK